MTAPAVWLPTVRAGTGTDTFTLRLATALQQRGIRAEITWLPHRAEFAPWMVETPSPPSWANVIHINSWLPSRFIPRDMPVVATVHSCAHDPALTPYKTTAQSLYHRLWVKHQEAATLCRATIATAVSRYAADQAMRIFYRSDIVTIPNWVDTQRFPPDGRQQPHHPFRLLFAGKPRSLKGADLLPTIMRRLGLGFVLYYTGTAEEFQHLAAPLPENMVALGRLQGDAAMATAYLDCDALLFPTRLEGFGLVALEAQSCARPVIATNCSSLPEVVVAGKTGFLCPMDDIAAFAEAARALSNDPVMWHNMGLAGRAHATTNFSEEAAVNHYIETYGQAISLKGPHESN